MEIAELFVVQPLDLTDPTPGTIALRTSFGRDGAPGGPLRTALAPRGIVLEAGAVVDFVLDGFDVSPEQLYAMHDLATLVFAVGRDLPLLRELDEPADLDVLATGGGGAFEVEAGPISSMLANLVRTLRGSKGWDVGGPALLRRLVDAASGYAQSRRLEEFSTDALTPALAAAARGVWKEALVEAACIVAGDESRVTQADVADTVGRLLGTVVGLAPELGPFLHGDGDARAVELVTQRFAVPAHVVRLSEPQIARALHATLELEVRDLLDAVRHLDPVAARPHLVRRFALAVLAADGSATAVVSATSATPPLREDVMDMMRAIARADGQITSDERALLRSFDTHLHAFGDLVARVEEDRVIDFDEFVQLREMRQTILDDLFRVALSDANVEEDERQLLLRAMELIPTLRSAAPSA